MKLLLALALLFGTSATAQEAALVIAHVTVVDVVTGERRPDQTVIVEGDRIAAVGPAADVTVPATAVVVDGSRRFLIPGLWDMHAHALLRWRWAAPLNVAFGVTGIRDMATDTPLAEIRRLRDDVAAGRALGPRIVAAGPLVDGVPPIFPEYPAIENEAEARAVVDSLADAGADFIKVYTRQPRDVFLAVVDQARRRGLRVAGHVPLTVSTAEASDAGLWSVEHVYRHRMACSAAEDEIRAALQQQVQAEAREDWGTYDALEEATLGLGIASYSVERCEALGRRLAGNGTWVVPTLVEMRSRFRPERYYEPRFDSLFTQVTLRYVPRHVVAGWRDGLAYQLGLRFGRAPSDSAFDAGERMRAREIETRLRMVGDLHRGGAGILAGTDAFESFPLVIYGVSLHEELALLVEAGLTPLEALQAATLNPALALERTGDHGAVSPGKLADLVLLDADPLDDIANTTRIHAVILNGELLDRSALDALLSRTEAEVTRE
jgi:imidazolonepropionase-like amidohydrolase